MTTLLLNVRNEDRGVSLVPLSFLLSKSGINSHTSTVGGEVKPTGVNFVVN